MNTVKTVLLAAALSFGTTMAIAQESGAGEKSTEPTFNNQDSGYEADAAPGVIIVPAPSGRFDGARTERRGAPLNSGQYEGELGDGVGTTGSGYMNQESR